MVTKYDYNPFCVDNEEIMLESDDGEWVKLKDYEDKDLENKGNLERIEILMTIINKNGICIHCGQLMEHHIDEPFASCFCGTDEWSREFTQHMQLQNKHSDKRIE